jgi:hypothetical protein
MIRNAFAGGNTPYGFYSYYDNILDSTCKGRLIILKGGPGVGKSSLIKNVGKALNEKNLDIEFFYCSGDNTSLDGVYCPSINTAVIDGTAPHMVDPVLPGITDEIVNLGVFINGEGVKENKDKILSNNAIKTRHFKNSYGYIAAAANLDNIEKDLYLSSINDNIIYKEAEDLISSLSSVGSVGRDRKLFLRAITPDGNVDFSKERIQSSKVINLISYSYNEINLFLSLIIPRLIAMGYHVESYFNPMRPLEREMLYIKELNTVIGNINGFKNEEIKVDCEIKEEKDVAITYIHENGIEYIVKDNDYIKIKDIDLTPSVDIEKIKPFKEMLECNKLLSSRIIRKAYEQLKSAQIIHKDSEKYYVMNMDWNGISKLTEELICDIIRTNNIN